MHVSRFRIGGLIALGFLVAACAGGPGTVTPTATGAPASPSALNPTASPEAGPSAMPAGGPTPATTRSAPPASPVASLRGSTAPSASTSATPGARSTSLGDEPAVTLWMHGSGSLQAQLLANVRDDAKVGCAATQVLPVGAVAGQECRPDLVLVALVDVYGFSSPDAALTGYRVRLAAESVGLRTGDCPAGQQGEAAWAPGDGQWGPGGIEPDREGCFADASGHANVLALCGNGVYIAIVGKTADLAALTAWTDRFPAAAMNAGRVSTPSPPGICYGGWGP